MRVTRTPPPFLLFKRYNRPFQLKLRRNALAVGTPPDSLARLRTLLRKGREGEENGRTEKGKGRRGEGKWYPHFLVESYAPGRGSNTPTFGRKLCPWSTSTTDDVLQSLYIATSDIIESTVTILSPLCEYNITSRVELRGQDLLCYSSKTESVGFTKCPCYH